MADIHNYKQSFERAIERIKENQVISEENKEIILNFKDYLLSEGIGLAKIGRYLCDLIKLSRMLRKTFSEADKEDLRHVVAELEQTNLAAETKKGFKIMLRKLYRFIRGVEEKGISVSKDEWIVIISILAFAFL